MAYVCGCAVMTMMQVYQECDVYLLDDCLSAVDSQVRRRHTTPAQHETAASQAGLTPCLVMAAG